MFETLKTKIYNEQWDHISSKNTEIISEKKQIDGYSLIQMDYDRSSFRQIERYLRIVDGLDEVDIH